MRCACAAPHSRHCRDAGAGKPYDFHSGSFYDLDANAVICANQSAFSGAHNDIRHPEMLWAVVSAAGLTS